MRSLFFDKTPQANWKVDRHQDLTIAVQDRVESTGDAQMGFDLTRRQ